ncbi:MAG: hypothetical protein ABIK68_12745 [bacterium]
MKRNRGSVGGGFLREIDVFQRELKQGGSVEPGIGVVKRLR